MLNQCQFIGVIPRDPTIKDFGKGVKVLNFSIGVNRKYFSKKAENGVGAWVPYETLWMNVSCWKGIEFFEKVLRKGLRVMVQGPLVVKKGKGDREFRYIDIRGHSDLIIPMASAQPRIAGRDDEYTLDDSDSANIAVDTDDGDSPF